MKRAVVIVGVCGWLLTGGLWTQTAYAGILAWPVVSQVANVVRCIVADVGSISKALVTHATGFVVETTQIVGKCLIYIGDQVTPGVIAEPSDHT